MRIVHAISAIAFIALAACGQAAAPGDAEAQPSAQAAQVSAADRTAILRAANAQADARGQVENDCGEKITPKFQPVELGGAVGTAVLFVMEGGPNTASCYGDGPGLTLFRRNGANWQMIYSSRGAMMVVLPASGANVREIVQGGPGFEHPLYRWNGAEYAMARQINESAMPQNVQYYPQD